MNKNILKVATQNTETNSTKELDRMSLRYTGDGQKPNMHFVMRNGKTIAVMVGDSFSAVLSYASSLTGKVIVSDRATGLLWKSNY